MYIYIYLFISIREYMSVFVFMNKIQHSESF